MARFLFSYKTLFTFLGYLLLFIFPLFAIPPQDSLLAAISVAKEDTHKVNLFIQLHGYYMDDDQKLAKENLDQILQLSNQLQYKKGQFKGHVYLASYLNYVDKYPQADSAAKLAFRIAMKEKNILWEAEAWKIKGSIYGSGWGKADSAYIFNERAAKLYEELELVGDHAFMKMKMGMMQHVLGKYDESLILLQEAIDVFRKKEEKARLGIALNSIGNVYSVLQNHELAKKYYEEALNFYEKDEKPFTRAIILFNLGLTISNLEEPENGFPHLKEAYHLFESLGSQTNASSSLSMIGYIFEKMNQLDSSVHYYQKAIAIQEANESYEELAISYLNLGFTLMQKDDLEQAEGYLLKVLNMKEVTIQTQTRLLAYQNLGETYTKWGKYQEATDYLGKSIVLKDSTMGEEVKAQIAQAEVDYQTKLKEAEIERQKLIIEQQQSRQNFIIALSILGLLLLVGGFLFYQNREENKKREAELIYQLRAVETENLREMDRVKSRFFANVSHEFRTPLTLILGPIRQLLKQFSSPIETLDRKKAKQSASLIQRNANRLLGLVNQLLDLSKLESGKMDLQLSRGDILAFVKGIVFSFESLAEIKQIRFHTYFPNQSVETSFDKDKLEKVLVNLMSNAFKFTPEEGDVRVEVLVESSIDQRTNRLSISIQDNGIGIPEDQMEHIFDRFYQIEGNEIQGTGIGLALTKELIELQQGEISVSSTPGEGSIFTILLPIHETIGIHEVVKESSDIHIFEAANEIASKLPTLLLVEDNPDVRTFIAEELIESYHLIEAENGKIGFDLACKHIPDLIITDVMMPIMDGNILTRQLKEDQRTSHIPVIMLTAKASKENKIEGLETGADDYLIKPFDGDELLVRIRNLIEQRKKLRERFKKNINLKPKDIAITSADDRFLEKLMSIIEERIDDEMLSVEELAGEMALSRSQLHRKIKALTDHSPSTFIRSIRLKRAKDLLENQAAGVAEIAYLVGFSSPTYFSKCFKDEFGLSPIEFKNNAVQ